VANWLYQVLGCVLAKLQSLLGEQGRFDCHGVYRDLCLKRPACGGQVVAFWGTEIGARRNQALVSYDYDCDCAAFITPAFDFPNAWKDLKDFLEPMGLNLIEHTKGFKYRVCPKTPLAYAPWKEFYHEAALANEGASRPELLKAAGALKKEQGQPAAPTGANCIDLEVYTVRSGKDIIIRGSSKIALKPSAAFPIVEAMFGPLRVPVLRSPVVLDGEYGANWRTSYEVKVCNQSGNGSYSLVADSSRTRRTIWPNVPLLHCGSLIGGYIGAGARVSSEDVEWRFL
jgi:hypothetical protein